MLIWIWALLPLQEAEIKITEVRHCGCPTKELRIIQTENAWKELLEERQKLIEKKLIPKKHIPLKVDFTKSTLLVLSHSGSHWPFWQGQIHKDHFKAYRDKEGNVRLDWRTVMKGRLVGGPPAHLHEPFSFIVLPRRRGKLMIRYRVGGKKPLIQRKFVKEYSDWKVVKEFSP